MVDATSGRDSEGDILIVDKALESPRNLKHALGEAHGEWVLLGADHEAIRECYEIRSDGVPLGFGLGIATALPGVKPKALQVGGAVYVGFDRFLGVVRRHSVSIEHKLLRLPGAFIDLMPLGPKNICVVHELGGIIVSTNLEEVASAATGIVGAWTMDEDRRGVTLTEMDSGSLITLRLAD